MTSLLWLLLAIASQASALQLIHAGPTVSYQHFIPLTELFTAGRSPFSLLLIVQAGLVTAGLRRRWRGIAATLGAWRPWALAMILLLVFVSSATLSREPSRYLGELAFAFVVQLVAIGNVVLVAGSISPRTIEGFAARLNSLFSNPVSESDSVPRIDRFALVVAGGAVLVAALLAILSYQRHPHVPDEVIYLLHARYFAKGLLWLPAPPVPPAFDVDLMYYEPTRWFSPVPPGWPAMLSIGVLLGVPWLVNPFLAGANILLTYRFAWELYDRRTARLAALLLGLSPWHAFMAMNFMTHTFTLSCALLAANAVAILRRTQRLRWAWLGGLGIGLVSLNRPLEGLALAGLLGIWTLRTRGRSFRFAPVATLAAATIATGLLTLPYNQLLTGRATKFPIMSYTDRFYGAGTNALGFGANRGLGWPGLDPLPGHGFLDVLVNASLNTSVLNVELFGWSAGSLVLLLLLVFSGAMKRADWLMLVSAATIIGVHSLYWFSGGPDFGARYWYLIIVPCVLLTARGAQLLATRLGEARPEHADARVLSGVFALCIAAAITFYPWRATDKYYHYRGMRPDIRTMTHKYHFGRSVVLIRGKRHPDYASAATYNPLDLYADAPVFAWDRGPEIRRRLAEVYRDRSVWIVDGPTRTGAGFRVVAGPLPFSQLEAALARAP